MHEVDANEEVKLVPKNEEFELYNVKWDPTDLSSPFGHLLHKNNRQELSGLLREQRAAKRLQPTSGPVPGQPV